MKILAIGNSFSQDAMRYLHQIGEAEGEEILCVNLYIGGCSLERHAQNIQTGERAYEYQVNGMAPEKEEKVSILEGIQAENWDVVTLQQASHLSFDWASFQPYLFQTADFVRRHVPKAKLMIHQTWAYEQDSQRLHEVAGYSHHEKMFEDLTTCYQRAARELGGVPMIPSGAAMILAAREGLTPIHRDTFHADLGYGRFLLGCVWFQALTGRPVSEGTVIPLDVSVPQERLEQAKKIAQRAFHMKLGEE